MKNTHRMLCRLLLALLLMGMVSACNDFVNDVDPPVDQIDGNRLTQESQMPFLMAGVQQRFATTYGQTIVLADALSDALFFDSEVPGAVLRSFEDIDFGEIELDNSSVEAQFVDLGELRFLADDLLRRAQEITFDDADLERQVFFVGNLYGGIARYLYATYTGLDETTGGGVLDGGPFVPAREMYRLAIERLQSALVYISDGYDESVLNSIIARCQLFSGNQAEAAAFAGRGLMAGDPPFQAKYNSESANFYWAQAGRGQTQFVVGDRFALFLEDDEAESTRVKIEEILGFDDETVYWRQKRYAGIDAPIPFISWQENELMLAELDLRANRVQEALDRVNAVRAFYQLSQLQGFEFDLDVLVDEREKTLFLQGLRLPDQRRFDLFDHLEEGAWQYLPITESERNNNPNLD